MMHQIHEFKLAEGAFRVCYILKWSAQLLDRNTLLRHLIVGGTA